MANGWGGRRVGSGKKGKTAREHAVTGDAGKRGRVISHPSSAASTAPPVIEEFDAPNDLTTDERNVWMELAPAAFKARTLTKASSFAFRLLCRNIVREKTLGESALDRNGPNHRGLIREVNTRLLQFNLAPCGKAMQDAAAEPLVPANPLDRFLKKASKA